MAKPGNSSSEKDLTRNGAHQAAASKRAPAVTRASFGRRAFVRAVVEVSSFCRENRAYCGMRRDNRARHRFRTQNEAVTTVSA